MNTESDFIAAVAQCVATGNVAKALQMALEGLARHPDSVLLLQAAGDLTMQCGDYDAAHRHFSRLTALDPRHAYALVNLALINLRSGRMEEYQNALNAALRCDPQAAGMLKSILRGNSPGRLSFEGAPAPGKVLNKPAAALAPIRVPVVLLQIVHNSILAPVVEQAKRHNPDTILIANGIPDNLRDRVEFGEMADFHDEATYFSGLYEHLSSNPRAAELFCFNRWFILKSYMERHGLAACLHIDSDVLLYINAKDEMLKHFNRGHALTLVHGSAASTSFLTLEGLRSFCDFLRRVYENKSASCYQSLVSIYRDATAQNRPGGVCDMTLLDLFRRESGSPIDEMTDVRDGATYDHHISISDGYEMHDGFKKIYPHEGYPYCKRLSDGRFIRFNCLHFQGRAKNILQAVADAVRQSSAPSTRP